MCISHEKEVVSLTRAIQLGYVILIYTNQSNHLLQYSCTVVKTKRVRFNRYFYTSIGPMTVTPAGWVPVMQWTYELSFLSMNSCCYTCSVVLLVLRTQHMTIGRSRRYLVSYQHISIVSDVFLYYERIKSYVQGDRKEGEKEEPL